MNSPSQSESPANRWITVMGIWYLTPVGEGLNCQTEVSIILNDLRADVQYVFPALPKYGNQSMSLQYGNRLAMS